MSKSGEGVKSNPKLKLQLSPDVSLCLRAEAKRRGIDHDDLAAEIIGAVVSHELFAAVLDH